MRTHRHQSPDVRPRRSATTIGHDNRPQRSTSVRGIVFDNRGRGHRKRQPTTRECRTPTARMSRVAIESFAPQQQQRGRRVLSMSSTIYENSKLTPPIHRSSTSMHLDYYTIVDVEYRRRIDRFGFTITSTIDLNNGSDTSSTRIHNFCLSLDCGASDQATTIVVTRVYHQMSTINSSQQVCVKRLGTN